MTVQTLQERAHGLPMAFALQDAQQEAMLTAAPRQASMCLWLT